MTLICQGRFTGCNTCTTLVQDVDVGEAGVEGGWCRRYMGTLCTFHLIFSEPKTYLKNKTYFLKKRNAFCLIEGTYKNFTGSIIFNGKMLRSILNQKQDENTHYHFSFQEIKV